jgi:hypothetical protein
MTIYRCTYNGCGKETDQKGQRCRHGRSLVEMRRVVAVPGSMTYSVAGKGVYKSSHVSE